MAHENLPRDKVAFGREVLLATDSLGMNAEGAFWLYDDEEREWRFFIVTSLFENTDARELYKCLNEAFDRILSRLESEQLRLFLVKPNEPLVREIRAQAETRSRVSEPVRRDLQIGGKETAAIVYRMAQAPDPRQATTLKRRFRQSCKELAAAE